jgi:TRAP transporter TAXI family solute receptor
MGGGAQPATWFGFLHRWCVVLAAAAMTVVGSAQVDVQAAPVTKRTAPAATPKTAPAATPKTAPASPAAPAQTTAQARKPTKVARRPKHERASDRAGADLGERLNKGTLVIISGGLQSTDLAITHQLSDVLDDGDDLRIVPMVGAGGSRNIRDVRFMKGIDLGITQTSLLARLRQSGEIGPLDDKIVYLAKLFNEELHIVVRADSGLASIDDLKGRTVSLGEPGSGTQLIAHDVLDRLGIAVREVNMAGADAIERMDTGEIDAVALIGGKPIPAVAQRSGLRLIAVPFARPLHDDFLPASLTGEDYPGLVEPGRRVDTVAVGTVLIAYNWAKDSDQYKKIRKFVGAFFPQIAKLQAAPHHPKWREVNLAATLPGWPRFAAAETWLAQHKDNVPVEARVKFDEFVRARGGQAGSAEDHEKLFQEFLHWSEARARR